MPRLKNPNPRQVTEGEDNNAIGDVDVDHSARLADSPSSDPHGIGETSAAVQEATLFEKCENQQTSQMETLSHDSPITATPTARFSAFNESNKFEPVDNTFIPLDNGVELDGHSDKQHGNQKSTDKPNLEPMHLPTFRPSLPKQSSRASLVYSMRASKSTLGRFTPKTSPMEIKRPKSTSPGMLNPKVMIWMKNRFQLRPGGRISASDIILLYQSDTKDLPDPPPGLQNYQVGQLLRRVFPNISRAKITVNSKRLWIYRHLNLRENPPADLFEEQKFSLDLESSENGISGVDLSVDDNCRASDSPMSNYEDSNSPSPISMEEDSQGVDAENKQKSNTILLELLGNGIKTEADSPTSFGIKELFNADEKKEQSYLEMGHRNIADDGLQPKKKRDSEVMEWLQENYKFKPGYYVKSMDLLRQYNHGRDEMVKYLSQVGRVMKHVFPSVRHLRKSFKGGKREWVYLNIKPIDVDSDSEEGKKMLMPTLRRSAAAFSTSIFDSNMRSQLSSWNDERANMSHNPLSMVPSSLFKSKPNFYHSVSRVDGSKLVISRSPTVIPTQDSNSPKRNENSPNKTQIVLYNKNSVPPENSEVTGAPMELERDLFAPFAKTSQHSDDPRSLKRFNVNLRNYVASCTSQNPDNRKTLTNPSSGIVFSQASITMSCNTDAAQSTEFQTTGDDCWASKRLRLCATLDSDQADGQTKTDINLSNGLDLSIKREVQVSDVIQTEPQKLTVMGKSETASEFFTPSGILNLSKPIATKTSIQTVLSKPPTSQTIHYKPESLITLKIQKNLQGKTVVIGSNGRRHSADSIKKPLIIPKADSSTATKRAYVDVGGSYNNDIPITWNSLQNFAAQRYGWLKSSSTSCSNRRNNEIDGGRSAKFVEWFLFSGQWLVNGQRALREIKIYDDWTVVIHALGRRVYPNDLGGITDLEKTSSSLSKVFRVLAEAKMCMGFPAPCISDLYIHGILVSKFEVWSSREGPGEDIRQRAVNCQILYSGTGTCCTKCSRIMKLHQQQKRGPGQNRKFDNSVDLDSKHPTM
uniref:uncharacterized protein LOC120340607 n=1 Tax=Styela clava TaxID=7725 RepID=UPI00193A9B50|nr:uncharacterized protein LOC120340607 [Styela clava]